MPRCAEALAQGPRCALVAPRRAADPEVDAAGEERLQHAEVLGDLEGAVVAEHHAARAHAEVRGAHRHLADEDLRAGAGQGRAGVVLGQPVAVVAEPVDDLGQLQGLVDGVGRGCLRCGWGTGRGR